MNVSVGDRVALVVDERNMKNVSVLTVTGVTDRHVVAGSKTFHRSSGREVKYASRKLPEPVMNRYITTMDNPAVLRILAMQIVNGVADSANARRIFRQVSVSEASKRIREIEASVRQARRLLDELSRRYY